MPKEKGEKRPRKKVGAVKIAKGNNNKPMNEMTEYYNTISDYVPKPKPKKEHHKGNWDLVWIVGNYTQVVLSNKPYVICGQKRDKVRNEPQFKGGEFKIVPYGQK